MDVSLNPEITTTLLRALHVAVWTTLCATLLANALRSCSPRSRRLTWILLLVIYLTPALFAAYAYANFTGWLSWTPALREVGYQLLIILRMLLPALLVLNLVPPRLSPEARYLLKRSPQARGFRSGLLGSGGPLLLSGSLVFLLVFNEFEYASFFLIPSWTVKLFDAQVGGLLLTHSLRLVMLPFLIEAAVLITALCLLQFLTRYPAQKQATIKPLRVVPSALPLLGIGLIVLLPALLMLKDLFSGFDLLAEGFLIGEEWKASLLFALFSAGLAYGITRLGRLSWAAALPGLLGSLVLGLTLIALFQSSFFYRLYDTGIPLILGTTLWILPCAVLYASAIQHHGQGTNAFLGKRSRQPGQIHWELVARHRLGLFLCLFCLGWFDLTLSTLLAPSQWTPLPVRLYNFMHYGQSARLTAMVFVTLITPLALIALAFPIGKRWVHQ